MAEPGNQSGKSWVNTRARIQRLADGKFFAGPVTRDVATGLTVNLSNDTLEVGDECTIQLFGFTSRLVFATCVLAENGDFNFRIDKVIQDKRPPTSEPRLVNIDMMATVRTGEDLFSVRVLDASPTGMGVLCDQAIDRETMIAVNVRIGEKVVRMNGKIIYCGKATNHTFRLGIRLGAASSEDRETWLSQFDSIA